MINYFEILNISTNAEIEVICSSYKALAKKYHPDNTDLSKERAEEKMMLINEAYRVLSDDNLRKKHLDELQLASRYAKDDEERETSYTRYEENVSVTNDSSETVYKVVMLIIVISIVCCAIYFLPGVISDAFGNIGEKISDIVNSF